MIQSKKVYIFDLQLRRCQGGGDPVGSAVNEKRREYYWIRMNVERTRFCPSNQPSGDVEIDLKRVFHNFKLRTRAYAWLMIFCIVAGIAGSLVIHQVTESRTRSPRWSR